MEAAVDLTATGDYWARWNPDGVAIRWADRDIMWSELKNRTIALAAGLQQHGVQPGDRVGIFANNSVEWCEAVLAIYRAGGIVVPLNIRLTPREIAYMVDDAGCKAVMYDNSLGEVFAPVAANRPALLTIGFSDAEARVRFEDLADADGRGCSQVTRGSDDVAIIAYTSGTTGSPKGAMLTHGNIHAMISQWQHAERWTSDTKILLCVPLAFTGGIVSNFMVAYGIGGTLVLEPSLDPVRALDLLVNTPINAMAGVPVIWQAISALPGFAEADLSAFTSAITGGAPVHLMTAYLDKGVHIRQAYALTEASASACLLPPAFAVSKAHSAGLPLMHTKIRIVDDNDADVATGEVGQILIQGPQVMKGYWNRLEETAKALAGGWLHTGDLGYLDADGLLTVVDRQNDMIKSGGLNVYPAEIEKIIMTLDGVSEVGAFGVPHDKWGETVAVAVGGRDIDVDALLAHCRENLGDYKIPRYVVLATEPLPRSMSGKILRRELRASFDESAAVRTAPVGKTDR
jgi:fatty-acyl-CoA synthase